MKIQVLADLHGEFVVYETANKQEVETFSKMKNVHADLTVVAGDLHTKGRGIELAACMWPDRPAILVAGNHEFYGQPWPAHIDRLKELAADHSNVYILENDAVEIKDLVILGCTLWTDCKLWEAGPWAGLFTYEGGQGHSIFIALS